MGYDTSTDNGGMPEAAVVADLARQAATLQPVEPGELYVDGHGNVICLDSFGNHPRRKTGRYTFATLEAFIAYLKVFESDKLTVWVPNREGSISAVLDDHSANVAQWGEHRATLTLEKTDEWQHWLARDGVLGTQQEFAEHVEKGVGEVWLPDGATMLELAQSFHASVGGAFKSVRRLQDGSLDVQVVEDIDAKAGFNGQIEVPKEFVLRLSPFIGEDPHELTARLRYRLRDGALTIGYMLDRPNKILEAAFTAIHDELAGEFVDRVYRGSPR